MAVALIIFALFMYKKVISACSLKQDLDIFPHGDETEVSIALRILVLTSFDVCEFSPNIWRQNVKCGTPARLDSPTENYAG